MLKYSCAKTTQPDPSPCLFHFSSLRQHSPIISHFSKLDRKLKLVFTSLWQACKQGNGKSFNHFNNWKLFVLWEHKCCNLYCVFFGCRLHICFCWDHQMIILQKQSLICSPVCFKSCWSSALCVSPNESAKKWSKVDAYFSHNIWYIFFFISRPQFWKEYFLKFVFKLNIWGKS